MSDFYDLDGETEPYWMDDLYQYNLSEADDYRDVFDLLDEDSGWEDQGSYDYD